jgi:glutaredoxin-related protein
MLRTKEKTKQIRQKEKKQKARKKGQTINLKEKKEELKKNFRLVGIREAVNFLKKELKLRFGEKSIENQIVRKKIGKLVNIGKRKIRVFSSDDVEKLKKLYEQYNPFLLRKKYKAIGISELRNILSKYGINKTRRSLDGLISRLTEKNEIKKIYEKFQGKRMLAFTKETVDKIISYLKKKQ